VLAFVALGLVLLARNLIDLSGSPPGLYIDEASIGYNAWAVAHFGVDEHGIRLPLYFEAFGEFKNPVYVYALVPILRVLPLTATVERLPAAIFGLITIFFITLAAWQLSRSALVTAAALVLAALTPWLTQESRTGFEVISMVAALSGVVWALATESGATAKRFALAGIFLAIAMYGYSVGRLEVLLLTVAFVLVYGAARHRRPKWWVTLVPVLAAYGVLGMWALLNPGGLTAHFATLSIASNHASLPTLIARFSANYIQYLSPDFLFLHGDANPRHNTGYAGMLLAVTAPVLIAGLVMCWRRRNQPFPRFLILCLLLGPFAAALTDNGGQPHALRSADMLPFWLALAVYGLIGIVGLARSHRSAAVAAAVLALGLLVQGGLYTYDMFSAYPSRAALAFDTGQEPALQLAQAEAHGGAVYVSTSLDEPYIDAFFALTPSPPQKRVSDDSSLGLAQLNVRELDPVAAEAAARPGDLLVLSAGDPVNGTVVRIASEDFGLVVVYRAS
jgi:hypothetical protein